MLLIPIFLFSYIINQRHFILQNLLEIHPYCVPKQNILFFRSRDIDHSEGPVDAVMMFPLIAFQRLHYIVIFFYYRFIFSLLKYADASQTV